MIDKIIFLLILFLPTQLSRHFWLRESYLFGLRIDYLSPTVYLQDLLVLPLIILFLRKYHKQFRQKKYFLFTGLYLITSLLNIYFSLSPIISFFYWLRISELVLFVLALGKYSKQTLNYLQKLLPLTVVFEFGLAVVQMIKQGSLGGVFWLLGERSFNIFTPGIARADWLGQVVLRPYGTFSHPNSLAGFILVALVFIFAKKELKTLDQLSLVAGCLLLFLSFSRTVWLTVFVLAFVYVLYLLKENFREWRLKLSFKYLATLSILPLTVFFFTQTAIAPSSFTVRQDLGELALKLIKSSSLLGVGGNNFVIALAQNQRVWEWLYWLQPVHNIFLLLAAEIGLVALVLFSVLMFIAMKRSLLVSCYWLSVALFAVILTGLFDHYWLTLIQNQFLFAAVLGLSFGLSDDKIRP
ncbi:MAG: O-antigen ligase family protein [Patescibacteria group bacterium]